MVLFNDGWKYEQRPLRPGTDSWVLLRDWNYFLIFMVPAGMAGINPTIYTPGTESGLYSPAQTTEFAHKAANRIKGLEVPLEPTIQGTYRGCWN